MQLAALECNAATQRGAGCDRAPDVPEAVFDAFVKRLNTTTAMMLPNETLTESNAWYNAGKVHYGAADRAQVLGTI